MICNDRNWQISMYELSWSLSFSCWYVCHYLSTKLYISMAAYIDLTWKKFCDQMILHPWGSLHLRRRVWRLPPSSRDKDDEHRHWMTLPMDVPGAWCHPSTTTAQHIPQTLPSSLRKEYLRFFEVMETSDFQHNFSWHHFTLPNWFLKYAWYLAFSTAFTNLHASPSHTRCQFGQEIITKGLDVLMEKNQETSCHRCRPRVLFQSWKPRSEFLKVFGWMTSETAWWPCLQEIAMLAIPHLKPRILRNPRYATLFLDQWADLGHDSHDSHDMCPIENLGIKLIKGHLASCTFCLHQVEHLQSGLNI